MSEDHALRGLKVLLVEDELLIAMDLEEGLQDHGAAVFYAPSMKKGLAMAEKEIDVALLDVTLQNGDTIQPVCERLAARGVPFVLHSGDLTKIQAGQEASSARLVAKPSELSTVVSALREAYDESMQPVRSVR